MVGGSEAIRWLAAIFPPSRARVDGVCWHDSVMRRVLPVLAALTFVGLLSSPSAAANPEARAAVIPGKGIGSVGLGMSLAQVRRALGQPTLAVRRLILPSGGRYVEYSWEVDGPRGIDTWTVGLRSGGKGQSLRVVRVATTLRSQRTREGLGVGSRPRAIVARYPSVSCQVRGSEDAFSGIWIVIAGRSAMTAFLLDDLPQEAGSVGRVIEVLVQRSWFSEVRGRCLDAWEWRRW